MSNECVDNAHENGAHVLKAVEHDDPTGNLMSDYIKDIPEDGEVEDGEIDDEEPCNSNNQQHIEASLDISAQNSHPSQAFSPRVENRQNATDSDRQRKREKHKKKHDKRSHGKHSNERSRHHSKRSHGEDDQNNSSPTYDAIKQKRARNGRVSEPAKSKAWYKNDTVDDVDDDMMGVYGRPPPSTRTRSPVSYYGTEIPSERYRSRSRSASGSAGTAESVGKKERLMDYLSGDEDEIDVHVASLEKDAIFRSRDDPREVSKRDQRKRQRKAKKSKEFMQRRRQRESQSNQRSFNQNEKQLCKYYMEGRCGKAENCHFSHDFKPPKKQELCKFYAISTCLKGEHCVYLHEEFPCKFYHTGSKFCREAEDCKFSHDPLTDITRSLVERFVEERPFSLNDDDESYEFSEEKKNSLLGSPPAHMKNVKRKYEEKPPEQQPSFGQPIGQASSGPNELGHFEMRGRDPANSLSPPGMRSNTFYDNQHGNFGVRAPNSHQNMPRGHGGPMPRMGSSGPMRHHLGNGSISGPMRHPNGGPMRHPGSGNMGGPPMPQMGGQGWDSNLQDGGMSMGGSMGPNNFPDYDGADPHGGPIPRMGGPDNLPGGPGGPMPRMLNPANSMQNANCGPPSQHMFPMRGPPPQMNPAQPPFNLNCPPPGLQGQMPPRFRARMPMGAPPPGAMRLPHPHTHGIRPPHMQTDFMSSQLDKMAQIFMAGKEAAEKITAENEANQVAEEADEQEAKISDSNETQQPQEQENEIPVGAYVPQSTSVLPSVRLGDGSQLEESSDTQQAMSSQLMGFPTSTAEVSLGTPENPSPNITGSSPLSLGSNLNQNKEISWRVVALDVPVKTPYPLMQLPNDVPHLHNDPRLKGHAGVLRGKDIVGRRTSESNVEEGFAPIMPTALLEKPPPLKEFKLDSPGFVPVTPTPETPIEPITPIVASPITSPSHKPFQLQLNEMSTTFLQDSTAAYAAQQQQSRTDRSYLADPRFRRRKAHAGGSSPKGSSDAPNPQTATSPTS